MMDDIKKPVPTSGSTPPEEPVQNAGQSIPVFSDDSASTNSEPVSVPVSSDPTPEDIAAVIADTTSQPDAEPETPSEPSAEEFAPEAPAETETTEQPAVETPSEESATETTDSPETPAEESAEPATETSEPAGDWTVPAATEEPAATPEAEEVTPEAEESTPEPATDEESAADTPAEDAPTEPTTPEEPAQPVFHPSEEAVAEAEKIAEPTHGEATDAAIAAGAIATEPGTEVSTEHEASEQGEHHAPQVFSGGNSKMKMIVLAIIGVLVIALLAGAAFALFGKKDAKTAKTQTFVADIALLRVGGVDGPVGADTIYPNEAAAQMSLQLDFQVYEGLVGYSNQKIVPLLATSWTNPDNNTWVFKIKDGVKFQNGQVLTAQDVKTSLERQMKDEYWGQYTQTISAITANGNEVTIKTSAPDSLLLNRLVYGFIAKENADKTFSGTGAYTVDVANSKTEDKTRLVAFDGYHQGRPKVRSVQFTVYKDSESIVKDLSSGSLDYATVSKDEATAKTLATKGYASSTFDATGAYGLTLNMIKANSPLQKLEVRQALNYAMDRATYLAKDPSSTPSAYIVPITVVGYDETAKFPEFNAAKAKELVAKAGYPNGVPLTYNYIKGIQDEAVDITKVLNASGFKITAKAYASPKEFVKANSTGDYDMFGGAFSSDLGDGLDIFTNILGSKTSQFPSYNNAAFDKLLSDASQAFKPEDHVKKVQEINRYTKDNALWVPISVGATTVYYRSNYTYTLDAVNGLAGVYLWKLGESQTSSVSN